MKTRLFLSLMLVLCYVLSGMAKPNIESNYASKGSLRKADISMKITLSKTSNLSLDISNQINNKNNWSNSLSYSKELFSRMKSFFADEKIIYAEYFIDKDPGFGKGTALPITASSSISNHNFTVSLPATVSEGFHFITIRYKDALGRWSVSVARPFYKDKIEQSPSTLSNVVYAEYFIDKDPGFGKGSSIALTSGTEINNHSFAAVLPTTLEDGFHFVTVRYKDALGRWGVSSVRPFYKDKATQGTALSNIVYAEYFIDKDPGFGKGKSITIKGRQTLENLNFGVNLNALGLSLGKHFIQLRAKDANGIWGTVGTKTFVLTNEIVKMTTLPIVSCTLKKIDIPYIVEGTFGSNNVFTVELSDTSGIFQESPIQLGSLTSTKSATIRVDLPADLTGNNYKVRIVSTSPVRISDPQSLILKPSLPVVSVSSNLICQTTSAVLTATSCAGTVTWTGNLTGSSVTVTSTKTTSYKALCTVNGCKSDSSTAVTITVTPKPTTPVAKSNNNSVCLGTSAVLSATGCAGTVTWTGNLTGSSVTVTPTKTTSYKALCTVNGCKSDSSVATTITVNPKPAIPVAKSNNSSVCLGTSAILTATGCSGVVNWTGNLTGTSVTVTPTKTTSYKALCTVNGCKSDSSVATMITVTPKPSTPTIASNNASVCLGTSAVLSATGCAGTVTWTGNLTGSSVTVTPIKTSLYKALCTVNGCKSDSSTAVTITVSPKPTTPVAKSNNSSVCLGNIAVLSATGCVGTVTWTGNLTGSSVTVTPRKTASYKALCTVNGCKSDSSTAVTITVTPKPATPVAKSNNASVCLGTSALLSATGCVGTVTWTGNLTGSSVTVTPSKTSTYKALCTVNGCKSDSSVAVTITVTPKPATPVAKSNNASVCLGNVAILSATGCAGTVTWTGNLTGTSVTVTPTKTTSYKALCTMNGCKSDSSVATTITVNPKPTAPVAKSNNASVCLGTSAILSATGCAGTVTWTGNLTGSSVTVTPTKTSTYKALCTVNGCKSDSSVATTITVTPKPTQPKITANNATICSGGSSVLTASACTGRTLIWTGGLTGASITVSPTASKSYKVLCSVNGCTSDSSLATTITVIAKSAPPTIASKTTNDILIQWNKTLGGNNYEEMSSIISTRDGGFILGGSSYSDISGDKTQVGKGSYDYWIIKIDANGNKAWDKTLGGSNTDYKPVILSTNDGGYILGGTASSNISGDKTQASRGSYDYWVVKIDANGNKIWDKTFGGDDHEELSSILSASDGGFILAGYSYSGISGDKTQANKGEDDYWVVKIDANGNKVWDKAFGGSNYDELFSAINTSGSGYLLGGYSKSGISEDKTHTNKGGNDYWIIKIDANGNKIWDKTLGGNSYEELYSMVSTGDGGFILAGNSITDISGDKTQANKGEDDYWVVKIDANGNKVWDKTFGGNSADYYLTSIISTNDGSFLLGGRSKSDISGDKSQASKGLYDYWIVKIDANGNKIWDKTLGGSNNDYLKSLVLTNDGGYLLAGNSNSGISGDKTQASKGDFDYWIVKIKETSNNATTLTATGCTGTVTWSNGATGNSVTVSPTVATTYTATCTVNGCVSQPSNMITVTIPAKPTTPTVTVAATNICSGTSTTLTATVCTNGTLTWTGGLTGSSIAVSPTSTKSYRVVCTQQGISSDSSLATTVTVIAKPTQPKITASNATICVGSSSVLTSTACTSGTLTWTGGLTGSSITVSPTATKSYKVLCTVNGCKSDSSLATTIIVTPKPTQPKITTSNATICSGGSSVLTSTACTGGSLTWTGGLTGSSITVSPTATKSYKVLCTVNGCKSDSSLATTIIVTPKPTQPKITTSNATICSGGSSVLTASACTGGSLIWTGGLTGASITVSPTASKSYKVLCSVNGCTSDSSLATVITVRSKPNAPIITSNTCPNPILNQWNKTIKGNANDWLYAAIPTSDGGYLLGGISKSGIANDKSEANRGDYDYWIIKVNANGAKIWDKTFGGTKEDVLQSIVPTQDGGFVIAGYTISDISGDKTTSNKGYWDFWLLKIDSKGNKIWDKSLGGGLTEIQRDIVATNDGGFIVAGFSYSDIGGDKSEKSKGGADYWIIKINSNGTKVWDKTFGGNTDDQLTSITPTSDGGFIIGGYSNSNLGLDKTAQNKGGWDYWLLKINAKGTKVWDKSFGGNFDDVLDSVVPTSDGGFLIGGASQTGINGDKSEASKGYFDYWILKIDGNGVKVWDKTLGSDKNDYVQGIVTIRDGGYLIGGSSYSGKGGDKSEDTKGDWDFWVIKVDALGNKIWDKTLGGSKYEQFASMVSNGIDEFLLAGYSESDISGDKSETSLNGDIWITKVKQVCDPNNLLSSQKPTLTATGCTGTVTWSNGATGSSVTVSPTVATTYTATCTVNGCISAASNAISVSSSVVGNSTLPIEAAKTARVETIQTEPNVGYKVFPNPATNEINIETDLDGESTFQLYNSIGQKVVEKTFVKKTKISISDIGRGNHFYLIQNQDFRSTGKILLE